MDIVLLVVDIFCVVMGVLGLMVYTGALLDSDGKIGIRELMRPIDWYLMPVAIVLCFLPILNWT